MDKFFDSLFYDFGNNLKSVEFKVVDKDSEENKRYDALEKALNKKQLDMLDEFLLALADRMYEDNYHSFISGLKMGLKFLRLDGMPD